MESSTELAQLIGAVMRDRDLDRQGVAEILGVGDVMVDKLLCGDIVPSRSLEKQLAERLGIEASKGRRLTSRRRDSRKPLQEPMRSKRAA